MESKVFFILVSVLSSSILSPCAREVDWLARLWSSPSSFVEVSDEWLNSLQSTSVLKPDEDYFLEIRPTDRSNFQVVRYLQDLGIQPHIELSKHLLFQEDFDEGEGGAIFQNSIGQPLQISFNDRFDSTWLIPFRTRRAALQKLDVRLVLESSSIEDMSTFNLGIEPISFSTSLAGIFLPITALRDSIGNITTPALAAGYVPVFTKSYDGSPGILVVIEPFAFKIVFTADDFKSIEVLQISMDSSPALDMCEGSNGIAPQLHRALPYATHVILHTQGGLYVGYVQAKNSVAWNRTLNACIKSIHDDHATFSFNSHHQPTIFAVSQSNRLYKWRRSTPANVIEVLDIQNRSLQQAVKALHNRNDLTLHVISVKVEHVFGSILVLAKADTEYYLYAFDHMEKTWMTRCNLSGTSEISGMELSSFPSGDVAVFGTTLLLSSDLGHTFVEAFTCSSSTIRCISTVVTRHDGSFVARLTNNTALIFRTYIAEGISVKLPSLLDGISHRYVYADHLNNLIQIEISGSSSTLNIEAFRDNTSDLVRKSLRRQATVEGWKCPYRRLTLVWREARFNSFALQTRTEPVRIFLDLNASYSFEVHLIPHTQPAYDDPLNLLTLGKQQIFGGGVQVSIERQNSETSVMFKVVLRDQAMHFVQTSPGVNLRPTPIRFLILNDSAACDFPEQDDGIRETLNFDVLSGCPPGRMLRFESEISHDKREYCDEFYGIPCFYFDFEFAPRFSIVDMRTNQILPYSGNFTLTVIAAGDSPGALNEFSSTELQDFNEGSRTIWSALDAFSSTKAPFRSIFSNGTKLSWLCALGSPCYRVFPDFPLSPHLYLKIRASTKDAQVDSYCDYATEFVIRLHGLEMDYTIITVITVGSICVFIVMAFLGLVFYNNKAAVLIDNFETESRAACQ